MAYFTQDELLGGNPVQQWVDRNFLRSDPFAFQGQDFHSLKEEVARSLNVDCNGIYCVGSAAVGLSLNPRKVSGGSLKHFGADSDIDLAIVSGYHFEQAWRDLREAVQPTLPSFSRRIRRHLQNQKNRLFDGAILGHVLLPELSFGSHWQPKLIALNEEMVRMLDREISMKVWIYRDYWSIRNYVTKGIIMCRQRVAI